jgi:diguanylate cyclase (GGDEF)-like protein
MGTPRETAGVTTRLILAYVRRRAGEGGVQQVLRASGVPHASSELEDERFWCSYDDKIALLRAAGDLLHDPAIGRHVGESLFEEQVGTALRLFIGSLGSPQQVLRSVSKANAKFSTSSTMSTVQAGPRGGVVTYRLEPGNVPDRLDCDYTQGILTQVSALFGLPPADIVHPACQVAGAEACRYEVSWAPRRFRDRFKRRSRDLTNPYEADALRDQLADIQRTVADLVSTPDLTELLRRIADRAGASVRGQRYLLAVQLEGERTPRIHADGFAPDAATVLGSALLAGTAGGTEETRITTEVRSSQRRYGWLAAELPPNQGFLPAEQDQLDAFGRLAAAALDAATALEEARGRGETAEVLLRLGHELAREETELGIAQRIGAATPSVVSADRAMVLLWDGDAKVLRSAAVHGFGEDTVRASAFHIEREDATDEVAAMGRAPRQRWLTPEHPTGVHYGLAAWEASVVATAPIVVRGRLAALLLAVWDHDRPPTEPREVVLRRLAALGDQASTALTAARALTEARYRANHDALTGLANRVLFTARIEQALADSRRTGSRPVVCFIDLDGFKQVNDEHGHAAGDQLLVEVGRRIQALLRETDAAARLSGDEFGVLLRGLTDVEDAEVVAAKLVSTLAEPYLVDGQELTISASIGVAAEPPGGATPDQLLIAADAAMYRAKIERDTYRIAGAEMVGSGCG